MLFYTTRSKKRFFHDLGLASLLAMAAGAVNSAGFFAFDVLTTNVTGHMALLANDLVTYNWTAASMKALWMALFLLGAFVSSFIMQILQRFPLIASIIPLLVEIVILSVITYLGYCFYKYSLTISHVLTGGLLFAMGLQNALITITSGAVIRTTHLTGLFTDLGVNLAHLLFPSQKEKRNNDKKKIALLLIIATSFFIGGIVGGFLFASYLFLAFLFPLVLLNLALFYEVITFYRNRRKAKIKV